MRKKLLQISTIAVISGAALSGLGFGKTCQALNIVNKTGDRYEVSVSMINTNVLGSNVGNLKDVKVEMNQRVPLTLEDLGIKNNDIVATPLQNTYPGNRQNSLATDRFRVLIFCYPLDAQGQSIISDVIISDDSQSIIGDAKTIVRLFNSREFRIEPGSAGNPATLEVIDLETGG